MLRNERKEEIDFKCPSKLWQIINSFSNTSESTKKREVNRCQRSITVQNVEPKWKSRIAEEVSRIIAQTNMEFFCLGAFLA